MSKRSELAKGKNGRYTLEERIEQAREVHGNKYDYSLIKKYESAKTKVPIVCPKHGVFMLTFDSHIHKKRGCNFCSQRVRYDKERFVMKAKEVHGEDTYDYSSVRKFAVGEIKKGDKVEITCKKHGSFPTTLDNHLQGYGCPECGKEKSGNARKKSFEEFVNESRKIHGDVYKYDKSTYVNRNVDTRIICSQHGEFWQKPKKHLQGHGCQFCKSSRLEEEMRIFLDKNKVKYKAQYAPSFLKNGKGLQKLDFYLEDFNIAIECQGIQHFIKVNYPPFSNIEKTKNRDIMKFEKCLENNIKILYYTTEENMKFKNKCKIYNEMNLYYNIDETFDKIQKLL